MSFPAIISRLAAGVLILSMAQAYAVELKGKPVPLGDSDQALELSSNSASLPPPAAPETLPAPEIAPEVASEAAPMDPQLQAQSEKLKAQGEELKAHSEELIRLNGRDIQLTDEQLENLWTQHIGPEIGRALHEVDGESLSSAVMVPFIVFFFLFGCPTLIVISLLVLRHRAKGRHLANLNTNIDKLLAAGRDIPLELLRGDDPKGADDNSGLNKGIMNIGLGLGLLIFLTVISGFDVGALSFILIGMGVSRVIIWKLSQKKPIEQEFQG